MSSKFLHPFYFFLIAVSIFVVFSISVYLYILTPYRLEPIVLYYVGVSTESEGEIDTYVPEIRNIPMPIPMIISSMYKDDADVLTQFVHELFLGPQNIYAKNIIPTDIVLDDVYVVRDDALYIVLSSQKNSDEFAPQPLITPQDEDNIVKWVSYNVNKYFDIKKTLIIMNKVSIN